MAKVGPMRKSGLTFLATLIVLLSGCTGRPDGVEPVSPFDIERYKGVWYVSVRRHINIVIERRHQEMSLNADDIGYFLAIRLGLQ